MSTEKRVQTAFRIEESLLNRLKRKAHSQHQSLNSYVEALLKADLQTEPDFPSVSFPIPRSPRVDRIIDILPVFSEDELREDEKLNYILGK